MNQRYNTSVGNIIVIDDFFMPQLQARRRIWVYLPPDYYLKYSKRYPVLYMSDGQNLFDEASSFVGVWEIDNTLELFFKERKTEGVIVVGIDNGGGERLNEYSPWYNSIHGRCGGGKGEMYSDFIVTVLKPYIDSNFRTLRGSESTGIGGSSLGAFIAVYTGLRHQHMFSRLACFSPAFWFSRDNMESFVKRTVIQNKGLKIYMDAGTNEAEEPLKTAYTEDARYFSGLLNEKGADVKLVIDSEDGSHSERAWARRFPEAFLWLYGNSGY